MARIRTIKPEFFRHVDLYEAERDTGLPLRIAFAGLWTAADREGRFVWNARALKLDCLPYDDVDFSRVLDALATRGFIVKYACAGKEYGCIPTWKAHQVINNREAASTLPEPNEINTLTRAPRVDDACPTRLVHAQGEGKGKEGKGKEEDAAVAAIPVSSPIAVLRTGEPLDIEKPVFDPPAKRTPEAELYDRGKSVLGANSGGFVKRLLASKDGNIALARAALETASTKGDPREYIGAIINKRDGPAQDDTVIINGRVRHRW